MQLTNCQVAFAYQNKSFKLMGKNDLYAQSEMLDVKYDSITFRISSKREREQKSKFNRV